MVLLMAPKVPSSQSRLLEGLDTGVGDARFSNLEDLTAEDEPAAVMPFAISGITAFVNFAFLLEINSELIK